LSATLSIKNNKPTLSTIGGRHRSASILAILQPSGSQTQTLLSSVSKPTGRVPVPGLEDLFTGTWNIRETKNIYEISITSTIFNKKSHNKYLLPGQLATKLIVTGTKDKIFILPGLGPEKDESHYS
jgi:hypothetical protein